jgi:3-deoxy-D-manno-octulosonate 8-phosphate phosphatase (KDO 8-P phosphatase)
VTLGAILANPVAGAAPEVLARARRVRLVLTDCDGVLTDGTVFYSAYGEEMIRFGRRDGHGVERLRAAGLDAGIVSREASEIVARRAEKLGIRELHLGVREKGPLVLEIARRLGLAPEQVAFLGDDLPDVPALRAAGLAACPADAFAPVRAEAHYVCRASGGQGVFREVVELVLFARDPVNGS